MVVGVSTRSYAGSKPARCSSTSSSRASSSESSAISTRSGTRTGWLRFERATAAHSAGRGAGVQYFVVARASTPSDRSRGAPGSRLAVDPVRQLHEEAVVGPEREQIAEVAAQAARARDAGGRMTPLTPYDEQRRAGPVLPAQHDVGVELLVVESFAERGVAIRYVAAREVRRARVRRQLLPVAVSPL